MPLKSLSARLLILTAFFVMVGEVLIFVPSVARYRMTYFENRLAAGYIATLALDASPTGHLEQEPDGQASLPRRGAGCRSSTAPTGRCCGSTVPIRHGPTSRST